MSDPGHLPGRTGWRVQRLHGSGDGEQEWAKAAPAACAYFNLSLGAVDDLIEDIRGWLG